MANPTDKTKQVMQTYIQFGEGEEVREFIEFDLIFMREKGESQQFLEITTSWMDSQGQKQAIRKIIQSKDDFDALKKYFSQLVWDVNL